MGKDKLLSIIKYYPYKRNKAALTLFWDINGRNHEITILKLKHIRFREKYAEGEVTHEAKTGSGPILLTTSFPYVRDWISFSYHPDIHQVILLSLNCLKILEECLKEIQLSYRIRM